MDRTAIGANKRSDNPRPSRNGLAGLQFRAMLLDAVPESVIATDADYHVVFWNNGAEAMFGYTADEAMGHVLPALIHPLYERFSPAARKTFRDRLEERGFYRVQSQRRRKDGSVFWCDVNVTARQPSGYISIYRDVTKLRRSRRLLRRSREQLRRLAVRMMSIREEERAMLARELHDELGQVLTRLNMDLAWLMEQVPSTANAKRVSGMFRLVEDMLSTVRGLSLRLRPAILDDFGLKAAIEWQVHELADRDPDTRYVLDLQLEGVAPDTRRDTEVFRILQECLTNVARHAQATRVVVRARRRERSLGLEVADNGVGLPATKRSAPASIGLLSIRERAERLGGRIVFGRNRGRGTLISVEVPLTPDTE